MSDKIDQEIQKLFDVVNQQKQEMQNAEKLIQTSWKTNCSLPLPEAPNHPINLQTAPENRIKYLTAFLLQHRHFNELAEKELQLESTSTYEGFSYDDWINDCKKRMAVIQARTKKEKLRKLEERLNGIVSPEERRRMELAQISKELAG